MDQLRFLRFPLGNLTKEQTRKLATDLKIAVYDKPESQDICFVKSKSYVDVINKLRPQSYQKANIVYLDGKVLGVHNGIVHYTVDIFFLVSLIKFYRTLASQMQNPLIQDLAWRIIVGSKYFN